MRDLPPCRAVPQIDEKGRNWTSPTLGIYFQTLSGGEASNEGIQTKSNVEDEVLTISGEEQLLFLLR